ncbi:uncharacterized protein [Odocoileus virginianus]|uniref:Uncharacterized protein isoform X1 n=1 Tax=Odocoileus virginianus TaxID=9874 RepID=A0ABM4HZ13_ODOVR
MALVVKNLPANAGAAGDRWLTGTWSECSVSCGEGFRSWQVTCKHTRANGMVQALLLSVSPETGLWGEDPVPGTPVFRGLLNKGTSAAAVAPEDHCTNSSVINSESYMTTHFSNWRGCKTDGDTSFWRSPGTQCPARGSGSGPIGAARRVVGPPAPSCGPGHPACAPPAGCS